MSENNMNFEASLKSGITPDYRRIMKYDINRKAERDKIQSFRKSFYCLFVIAAGVFIWNRTVGIVVTVIALVLNLIIIAKTNVPKKAVLETYTEGNMVPAMIVSTNPLTVIALSSLNINDGHPNRLACYKLEPLELPDTKIVLYEKIPCVCGYRYDGGNYHASIQAFPLCWATDNNQDMKKIMAEIDKWNIENTDEYEVIKRIAKEYPELKHRQMLLLDENYQPIGLKYYWEEDYKPIHVEVDKSFPKKYPEIKYINDPIPAADFYNKVIDLAVNDCVYEYISTKGQEAGNPYGAENKGLFTYMSDPVPFLEEVAKQGIPLAAGEYPLFIGKSMATTKGLWRKQNFISWSQIEIGIDMDEKKQIAIEFENKLDVMFPMNRGYFPNNDGYNEAIWNEIFMTERQNIHVFLEDLVKLCVKSDAEREK